MPTAPLTFVTVVFEAEFDLLWLQARSMSRFVPPDLVDKILVIDNSARGMRGAVRPRIDTGYGDHTARVRVLRPEEICRVPGSSGWRSQQVLKLAVAHQVATQHYVVLDAKNHFVRPVAANDFVSRDGRARARVLSFHKHPLRPTFEHVLRYLGLDPSDHLGRFTPTVTPFVLHRGLVRSMIADIERRSGRSFAHEFIDEQLTEFFLYTGWLLARGHRLEAAFELHKEPHPVIWPRLAHHDGVTQVIELTDRQGPPVFAVHRKAFTRLDAEARATLSEFWARVGLFSSVNEAGGFITRYARTSHRATRVKWLRDLPGRGRRRLTRRLRR